CAAVADADRDGDADVVIGLAAGGVRLFRNQGSAQGGTRGAFAAAAEAFAPAASDVRAIAVGDVDGDGDLDLFCAVAGGPAELHVNQGGAQGGTTGLFQAAVAPALPAAAAPDARDVLLADVDGDGDLDAFLTGPAGETLLLNQGGAQGGERGRFVGAAAGALPASAGAGGRLAAGDMDGDGDLDIVVARGDAKTDTLLLNQGALQDGSRGVFAPATVAAFPADAATTLGVLLLDGDGDGDLDIFIRQADRERYFDNSRR
ncbi:MAG: VCBS repeat-containing protein, partial [Planctomycetes bacterium]|nr:VCBS repeat-containing protein [Planctomycetota bacterium]